jgi:RNA polymerase sigma factor (sigma-70 family)
MRDRVCGLLVNLGLAIDRHDAEDLVQDLWLKLCDRPHLFSGGDDKFSPWFLVSVLNKARDRFKSREAPETTSLDADERLARSLRAGHPFGETPVDPDAFQPRLKACFASLTDKQRSALTLYLCEDLDYETIAEALDATREQVRDRIRDALEIVRRKSAEDPHIREAARPIEEFRRRNHAGRSPAGGGQSEE